MKRERERERERPFLFCGSSSEQSGSSGPVDPCERGEPSLTVERRSSNQVHLWGTDWSYHTGGIARAHIRIYSQYGSTCTSM